MRAARKVLKAALLVLIGAVLAVPAVFVNTVIGYAPVLFYLFLVACCYTYCRVAQKAAAFDLMASTASCVRGQSVDFKLRVGNRSLIFLYDMRARFVVHDLFGNIAKEESVSLSIAPRSSHDFEFALGLPHVGEFSAGVESVIVQDPLGLFKRSVAVESSHNVLVMPRMHDVEALSFSATSKLETTDSLRSSSSDGSDYANVRLYEMGDPLKTIHWKLSAHSDDYLTKLFENHSEPRVDVYVNFAAPQESTISELMELNDIAIESALSIAAFAHERGLESSVVYVDTAGEAHRVQLGRSLDVRAFMHQVPLMGSADNGVFVDTFSACACSLHSADNVVLCSAVYDSAVVDALTRVKSARHGVALCALTPNDLAAGQCAKALGQLHALDGSNVRCLLLSSEMDVLR